MANSTMGELIFFMRGNKVKSKRSLELIRSKIRHEFHKELERPPRKRFAPSMSGRVRDTLIWNEFVMNLCFRRDNWTFDELLSRSTYGKSRKSSNSLYDTNPCSPHSCYDSVLSPISVCPDPARKVFRVLSLVIVSNEVHIQPSLTVLLTHILSYNMQSWILRPILLQSCMVYIDMVYII